MIARRTVWYWLLWAGVFAFGTIFLAGLLRNREFYALCDQYALTVLKDSKFHTIARVREMDCTSALFGSFCRFRNMPGGKSDLRLDKGQVLFGSNSDSLRESPNLDQFMVFLIYKSPGDTYLLDQNIYGIQPGLLSGFEVYLLPKPLQSEEVSCDSLAK